MSNLKGTETLKNLMAAFAGESQARNRYTFWSSIAKKEGYVEVSKIFEETANQEKEHAKYQCRDSGYQATIGRQTLHHGPPLPE